ncbi:DUF1127 domain-containing protein [Sulfitobacter marinus]|nr:DUF1127 domain-containing protein [Sulfitobacter marinus]
MGIGYSFLSTALTWQFLRKPQEGVTILRISPAKAQNFAQKLAISAMFALHSSIAKFFIVQMQQLGQKGFRKALVANQQKDQTHPSSSRMFLFRRRHLPPPWCRRHFFILSQIFRTLRQLFVCICCIAALSICVLCKCSIFLHIGHNRTKHRSNERGAEMAYLNATTAPSLADRFNAVMSMIATRRKQARVYRATFNELSSLSNRELADLGMSRSQIRSIALETGRNAA